MTGTLFALVLTTYLTTGEVQDSVIEIYPIYIECLQAAEQQKIEGNCYHVDEIVHQEENKIPAGY